METQKENEIVDYETQDIFILKNLGIGMLVLWIIGIAVFVGISYCL